MDLPDLRQRDRDWHWDEYDMITDEAHEREVAERTLALHTSDSVHDIDLVKKLNDNIDELEELIVGMVQEA